jgi:hypothetical protein
VDASGIEEINLAELVIRYAAAISCPLWMPSVLAFKNTEILSSSRFSRADCTVENFKELGNLITGWLMLIFILLTC